MKITFLVFLVCMLLPPVALGADFPSTPSPAKPATSKVDPALEAARRLAQVSPTASIAG